MNETTVTTVKAAIAAAVATMTALWGWFGWLVIAWVLLMLADWLIGSAAAAKEGRWSSAKMREGAWHKGGMILWCASPWWRTGCSGASWGISRRCPCPLIIPSCWRRW